MKKITLFLMVCSITGFSQNLISNGTFDDGTGWTIVNHYGAENTNGSVTISNGAATFNEVTGGPDDWKHMGIYTTVNLGVGMYQFDMNVSYTNIADAWGEVYIGLTAPVQHSDYLGDQQILKAYNTWNCPSIATYNGLAASSGCSEEAIPGQFEITTAGLYYLLFRTGGNTYGPNGIVIDNISLTSVATASLDEDFVSNEIAIYPNPTNSTWNFSSESLNIESYILSDVFGKKIVEGQPNETLFSLDASNLSSGVYVVTVATDNGTFSRKLIKK